MDQHHSQPLHGVLHRQIYALILLAAAAAPLAAAQWEPQGPEGGNIFALGADPAHPEVVYAGGSTVWRSADGGTSWTFRGRGLPGANTFAMSGGVVYAGLPSVAGAGVWRSGDDGLTWTPTAALPAAPSWAAGANVLVADPRQTGRLWAGGPWSIWLTVDGGAHWTERSRGIPPKGYFGVSALALDPADGQLWAATRFGVFTATGDAKLWTKASDGLKGGHVGALAVDPTTPKVVLATNFAGIWRRQGNGRWTRQLAGRATELAFRGGRAFAAVSDDTGLATRIVYSDDHGLTWLSAPSSPDRPVVSLAGSAAGVFAGTFTRDGRGGVYRSLDGGATWQLARSGLTNLLTEVVASGPPGDGALYAASGGLYSIDAELQRSRDGGATWTPLTRPNDDPLAALVVEPSHADTLYATAAFSTGVFRSEDGGATWAATPTPWRARRLRLDPRRSRALWALASDGLHHSDDGAVSWQSSIVSTEREHFFQDLAVDPRDPATLWVGGSAGRSTAPRIWRSSDGGRTWVRRDAGIAGTIVASVAVDPTTTSTLFAATDAGLFRSTDSGASWSPLPGAGSPVTQVLATATSPTNVWAIAGAAREVRRSRDGGATWEAASAGLDGTPVMTLAVDPADPLKLWAGTGTRSVMVWRE